jgi:hypothetical protein
MKGDVALTPEEILSMTRLVLFVTNWKTSTKGAGEAVQFATSEIAKRLLSPVRSTLRAEAQL